MSQEKKKASTSTLWTRLFKAPSLKTYLNESKDDLGILAFAEYITVLCVGRGEAAERVIKRAGLERSFGHQLFRGARKPSRDTVLQLAFGFETDVEGAQALLRHAGHSGLYPRIQRDATISYCLENKYNLMETQHTLLELSLPTIGGDAK